MQHFRELVAEAFRQDPFVLVDVGAAGGLKSPWKEVSDLLHVVGFEPDGSSQMPAAHSRATWLSVGLSDRAGRVPFFLTKLPDGSSLLRPNTARLAAYARSDRFDVVQQTEIAVDTLTHQMELAGLARVDFIKVDTQGTELRILKGAEPFLARALGVEVEVEMMERYLEQDAFSDVDVFLRAQGFELFDFQRRFMKRKVGKDVGGPKGRMTHGTALYLRDAESLTAMLAGASDSREAAQTIRRALFALTAYGYSDEALEILQRLGSAYLPADEATRFSTALSQPGGGSFSVRLSRWLRHTIRGLRELVRPRPRSGTMGDEILGNPET